jgi:hypothetical protein
MSVQWWDGEAVVPGLFGNARFGQPPGLACCLGEPGGRTRSRHGARARGSGSRGNDLTRRRTRRMKRPNVLELLVMDVAGSEATLLAWVHAHGWPTGCRFTVTPHDGHCESQLFSIGYGHPMLVVINAVELQPGKTYTCRLVAVNEAGRSRRVHTKFQTTTATACASKPGCGHGGVGR